MMIEEVHRGPPPTVRYFVFLPMLANQVRSRSPLSERLSHIRPRNHIETESLHIDQILRSLKNRYSTLRFLHHCTKLPGAILSMLFRTWPSVDLAPLSQLHSLPKP